MVGIGRKRGIEERKSHTMHIMGGGFRCFWGKDPKNIFWLVLNICCGGGRIGVNFLGENSKFVLEPWKMNLLLLVLLSIFSFLISQDKHTLMDMNAPKNYNYNNTPSKDFNFQYYVIEGYSKCSPSK